MALKDQYEFKEELGTAGMSTLYLAMDRELGRPQAIKFLLPGLMANPEHAQRFEREAKIMAKLVHRNVVQIRSFHRERGEYAIVMEFVHGTDLRKALEKERRVPLPIALLILEEITQGLLAAHEAGVLHRDVKPANVMLSLDGDVKVLDFGLARDSVDVRGRVADLSLTRPGTLLGTVPYMSPEQLEQLKLDPRTDIFSLGAVAYELFAGHRAFPGEDYSEVSRNVRYRDPEPLEESNPEVTGSVRRLVSGMLAKDREQRFATMRQTLGEVRGCWDSVDPQGIWARCRGDVLARFALAPAEYSEAIRRAQPRDYSTLVAVYSAEAEAGLAGERECLAARLQGPRAEAVEAPSPKPDAGGAPSIVESVYVGKATARKVELHWGSGASTAERFEVQRRCAPDNSFLTVGYPAGDAAGFTDPTVESDKIYFYRVRGLSQAGHSQWSREVSVKTPRAGAQFGAVVARVVAVVAVAGLAGGAVWMWRARQPAAKPGASAAISKPAPDSGTAAAPGMAAPARGTAPAVVLPDHAPQPAAQRRSLPKGLLVLDSQPIGASVWLRRAARGTRWVQVGTTPFADSVAEGRWYVRLAKVGYAASSPPPVQVRAGSRTVASPSVLAEAEGTPKAATGSVWVVSVPPGAEAAIASVSDPTAWTYLGTTPVGSGDLEPGKWVVRVEAAGFRPAERTLSVESGQTQNVELDLERPAAPLPAPQKHGKGLLQVRIDPAGDITINTTRVVREGRWYSDSVETGIYRIHIERPGLAAVDTVMHVEPGRRCSLQNISER